jgi:hypothetical protein
METDILLHDIYLENNFRFDLNFTLRVYKYPSWAVSPIYEAVSSGLELALLWVLSFSSFRDAFTVRSGRMKGWGAYRFLFPHSWPHTWSVGGVERCPRVAGTVSAWCFQAGDFSWDHLIIPGSIVRTLCSTPMSILLEFFTLKFGFPKILSAW